MSFMPKDVQSDVSRTKQSFRDEVDINQIVARGRSGAALTHLAKGVPRYMDVADVGDYKGALDMIRSMDGYFAGLPSKARAAFKNDPREFLEAMETQEGRDILVELGMIQEPKARGAAVQPRNADGTFAETPDPVGGPA